MRAELKEEVHVEKHSVTMLERVMQASNIDEEGNVLYLDQKRLERKELGMPLYKNHPNGLGIYNFFKEHIWYMSKKRWPIALKLYRMFIKYSTWLREDGWKRNFYKKGIMIAPEMEKQTSTVVMPLNVDLTEAGEKVVVPMDLIKESLKGIDYIAGMDQCLCREATGCNDYPHDVACLFFGDGGRTVVKHGLAHQLTYEEACARVDKAAEAGLMGQAVWIEVEQLLWGIRNDHMDQMLEICFCCPCCCITMNLARAAKPEDRFIFHPSGWTAVPDRTKCIGCRECSPEVHGCPMEAITFGEDGRVMIDQEICVGCGICKTKCPHDVIKLKQTMPMRKDLHEYYLKEFSIDLKLWDKVEERK